MLDSKTQEHYKCLVKWFGYRFTHPVDDVKCVAKSGPKWHCGNLRFKSRLSFEVLIFYSVNHWWVCIYWEISVWENEYGIPGRANATFALSHLRHFFRFCPSRCASMIAHHHIPIRVQLFNTLIRGKILHNLINLYTSILRSAICSTADGHFF